MGLWTHLPDLPHQAIGRLAVGPQAVGVRPGRRAQGIQGLELAIQLAGKH